MEITFNNPQTRMFFKEIFIELFQENKTFFTDIVKEVTDELNTSQTTFKDSQNDFDNSKVSKPKAGVYYKCGVQAHSERNDKTRYKKQDSWDSFLENIDEFAVDTGIEDFSVNLDHYLYGHPKR